MGYRTPPAPKKGTRHPGAGRVKGTPNRVSIEARTLASLLVTSPNYQAKLLKDFEARKVHPTIESLIWQYHIGKPVQPVLMASMNVPGRLAEEKAAFAALDLHDLEQLAAESQRLVDRAFQLAKLANGGVVPPAAPQDVVEETVSANGRAGNAKENSESDNKRYAPLEENSPISHGDKE